ncbi:NUDIX hydrolase [Actinomadura flavalba]|uniref:NUDIX hydrolase n=1 Tax=Actinomadura flavalba TaxID=1120938 RepID=UPI00037A7B01|nr:NUDIX domain-containing protein [Actinomadura flavalba]
MADPIRAAGAVLWRDGPSGVQVAVAHRPHYDDWSFPKGKLDPGEHILETVVREVIEETGVVPRLGRRLPTITYEVGGRAKTVDYWAATPVAAPEFTPNDEVDALEWLDVEAAADRLSYAHDAGLLRAFAAAPARTWPLVVLRHASAGDKHAWTEPDELRPLDARGRTDAALVSGLLAAFGRFQVVSSATARCLETVLPYVRRTRAPLRTDAELTVGEPHTGGLVDGLLAAAAPAVLCTHGETVGHLVTALCATLKADPPDDPCLPKAGFWVAHIGDGALVALERHTADV